MNRIENCRIKSTMLGNEDHGIFTCYLYLEGDGWGCGFGGYAMDVWTESKKRRVGSAYGMEFIKAILRTLELERWEQLPGTLLRAESEGVGGKIIRIGHYMKDKWFNPAELKEFEHIA